uniref:RRM domain-containing protein n=1 Tax=Aegilops tauschii subsp. strangulata TaxID=200361 RepID=A0A453A7Y6_AEGTS
RAQAGGRMRPVFVGNLDYDTRHSELDRLFYRYGRIERIDMKSGTAEANIHSSPRGSSTHPPFTPASSGHHSLHLAIRFPDAL